ncbi:TAXI family TRAP transporter solute-binding subunit [Paracoccus aerodenitrificans]|uniref:TAXI family TRAP transporter solute-binding subunit n=1 Tax=Paracoccus aerodenitrificans TaxID=3017781 RepID=UPI0022F07650|nr:TAXI family TRAP transporter solute-binding subunit [Paracoccus aerodenitrificans]WBU65062.1 TAXI family TRAP transporter solute-binding subunit [Paracoccus aerodenitrificans]
MRRLLVLLAVLVAYALPATAQDNRPELRFFRIGNGSTAGTYYPIGGIIAAAISNPPGAAECSDGGYCGVPGLLASAVASAGSVENVEAIGKGALESGFAQADVAYWAQTGTGNFAGLPAIANLRAIASLYPETLHIVARKDAGVETLADLRGKRVSLDEPGSGTLVDARLVLDAAGLKDEDMTVLHLPAARAAAAMQAGELDVFFFVGGYPAPAISQLAGQADVTLVPVSDEVVARLTGPRAFFLPGTLPRGAYRGVEQDVATLSVGALWLTAAEQPDDLIYAITRVLWNDYTMRQLAYGHPVGRRIIRNNALNGIAIPLHPGAERYYREAGLLK